MRWKHREAAREVKSPERPLTKEVPLMTPVVSPTEARSRRSRPWPPPTAACAVRVAHGQTGLRDPVPVQPRRELRRRHRHLHLPPVRARPAEGCQCPRRGAVTERQLASQQGGGGLLHPVTHSNTRTVLTGLRRRTRWLAVTGTTGDTINGPVERPNDKDIKLGRSVVQLLAVRPAPARVAGPDGPAPGQGPLHQVAGGPGWPGWLTAARSGPRDDDQAAWRF